jgi:protocatechuate 3,4-dioxygenase beta subunit
MHDDDRPVGRVLGRREVVRLLAIGGAAAAGSWRATLLAQLGGSAASSAVPACVVRPELDEGPFFVDRQLNRSDVRLDPASGVISAGMPLSLTFSLTQLSNGACTRLSSAILDIWQCDAAGVYSGVSGPGQRDQAPGGKALRGYQVSDEQGHARFTTIYPGWYQGRAVHIHFKIRTSAAPAGAYEFTSQLFFDEQLTDQVHARTPYSLRGRRDTLNQTDGIFRRGGAQMLLTPTTQGEAMAASFAIALDLSDAGTGRPDGGSRGRGRGRGRGISPAL